MSDARTKKNHGHFYLYDYSRAMLASILVPLFLRRKTVLPAGRSNNKPTTSVKERSSTNFIRRALSFLSLSPPRYQSHVPQPQNGGKVASWSPVGGLSA